MSACACCGGSGEAGSLINYCRMPSGLGKCPRCGGSGAEPSAPLIHAGLALRNRRSGKVWVVYGDYGERMSGVARPWGIHRMIPDRVNRGHYVWQIILRPEAALLEPKRWAPVGFGDAWDHDLMESDPLTRRR